MASIDKKKTTKPVALWIEYDEHPTKDSIKLAYIKLIDPSTLFRIQLPWVTRLREGEVNSYGKFGEL